MVFEEKKNTPALVSVVECILGESLYQPPQKKGADSMRVEAGECIFDESESDLSEDRAEKMDAWVREEDLGECEIDESINPGGDPGVCFFGAVGEEVDKTEEEAERLIVSEDDAQRCGASCDPGEPTEVPAGSAFTDSDPGSAPGHADEENGCHACSKFEGASAREYSLEKTYTTAETVVRTRGDAEPLTGAAVAFDLRIEGENDAAICSVTIQAVEEEVSRKRDRRQ